MIEGARASYQGFSTLYIATTRAKMLGVTLMGAEMARSPRRILVADDSNDDVELLRRAVEHAKVPWTIAAVCRDGEEAIRHLERLAHPKSTLPSPEMLLLDLKMPRLGGFAVLAWLRTNLPDRMKTIVMSSSPQPADIERARELGAERYIIKPSAFDELVVVVKRLDDLMSEKRDAQRTAPFVQSSF